MFNFEPSNYSNQHVSVCQIPNVETAREVINYCKLHVAASETRRDRLMGCCCDGWSMGGF